MILGNVQKIIIGIFSLLLILILGTIIWTFSEAHKNSNWPPTVQTCPDFWKETVKNNVNGCYPVKDITNTCTANTFFPIADVNYCNKYKWSTGDTTAIDVASCGNVLWDGINYGYGQYNPCNENYHPQTI